MMETNKLNFLKRTDVKRDVWSDDETNLFIQRFNLYENEVGRNKRFRSKQAFFSWIATEMAIFLGSSKTADQVSSRYYTLSRASKKSKSDIRADVMNGSYIADMSDLPTVNKPLFVYVKDGSVIMNEFVAMNGSIVIDDCNTSDEAVLDDALNIDANESTEVTSEALTADMNGSMCTDVFENFNIHTNDSVEVTDTGKASTADTDGTMSTDVFETIGELSRAENVSNIVASSIYNIRTGNSDDPRISGNDGFTSTGSSSIFKIAEVASLARSSIIPRAGCAYSTDSASAAIITQPSNSSRTCCVTSKATSPSTLSIRSTLSGNATLSSGNGVNDHWTDEQTKWLLDQYYYHMDDVGPLKTFRTKKDMWQKLASVMGVLFGLNRTDEQLSKRVQSLIVAKKKAVDQNRKSGASRVTVEYEEEISRIADIDDSIEPEILRDSHSISYNKSSKIIGQHQSKKPRWDKPNKKSILSSISESMLSIEERRTEREKSKEERRKQMHEQTMELVLSLKRREN